MTWTWPQTRAAVIGATVIVAAVGFITAGSPSDTISAVRDPLVLEDARRLTLEAEGFVGTPYHPTPDSGVTIGYGYDMGRRTSADIRRDLVAVEPPIEPEWVLRLGDAAGLTGGEADAFVAENDDIAIDNEQGLFLFEETYLAETVAARDFAIHPETYSWLGVDYPPAVWEDLGPEIVGIVIDLKFRGDYRPWWSQQQDLQAAIVANDPWLVLEQLRRIEIFPDDLATLAPARFEARVEWMARVLDR